MAKIKKENIIVRDPNTQEMKGALVFDVDINVSAGGLFYTTLPEETSKLLSDMNIPLETNRKNKKGYFDANSLPALIDKIKNKCKDYFTREVIYDKIVIDYSIETYCNYVFNDDGKICPNGSYAENWDSRESKDRWKHGTRESRPTETFPFSLQVYVKPMRKIIYKYISGKETVEYKRIDFEYNDSRYYLKWLNDIIQITSPEKGFSGELEYTEERAKFFADILKGICNMNEKIKPLFESKDNLQQLIDNGTKLLG